MGISRVQVGSLGSASGSGSSISSTINGVAVGALLVAAAQWEEGATLSSVTDDLSVAASTDIDFDWATGTEWISLRYFAGHGGGNRVVTANFSAPTTFRSISVAEYSGASQDPASVKGPTSSNTGSSAAPAGASVTPSQDGALIVGMCGGGAVPTAGSPFTVVSHDDSNFNNVEDNIQLSAAAITPSWTQANTIWSAIVAVFYPAVVVKLPSGRPLAPQQRMVA